MWNYDQGNYDIVRDKATSFEWDHIKDDNNNTNNQAKNITTAVTSIVNECIPYQYIKIKPTERDLSGHGNELILNQKTNFESDWRTF